MTPRALLARALAVAVAQTAVQVGLLVALTTVLGIALAPVNAALLLFATAVLGAVWATRQHLAGASTSPSLAAAVAPLLASAFFVAPRVVLGPARPALATVAIVALVAPLVERAWARWITPDDVAAPAARAALSEAAPVLAVGLAANAVHGSPWITLAALIAAVAIAGLAFARARTSERETARFADWVHRIAVEPDSVVCPEPPRFREPNLHRQARELADRAERLAIEASDDARARGQIADARELRTRFMASMSHELRSPLNSIVGFAQVLEQGIDGELSEGARESVEVIRKSAEELILLLTDVLDLARLEAGKLTLARRWTPSVEILTEAVRVARTLVEGRDVNIEAELQPGLPPVFVDQPRIQQAIVALFRNAAPFLAKTVVRLRARIAYGPPGPERHLRVEIHDALGAIPQEDVDRIFEAFQEITEPTGRRVGGLGMALTLSRGLVRLHGGEVWVDSLPGAGTVLCVAIPLDPPRPVAGH